MNCWYTVVACRATSKQPYDETRQKVHKISYQQGIPLLPVVKTGHHVKVYLSPPLFLHLPLFPCFYEQGRLPYLGTSHFWRESSGLKNMHWYKLYLITCHVKIFLHILGAFQSKNYCKMAYYLLQVLWLLSKLKMILE